MEPKRAHIVQESFDTVVDGALEDAITTQRVSVSVPTRRYLCRLLSSFLTRNPADFDRGFGVELLESEQAGAAVRNERLKGVADSTLFLVGMFLDFLEAKLPAVGYYYSVGSSAYLGLGRTLGGDDPLERELATTYMDLGNRFEAYAEVLCTMADRSLFRSNERLLALQKRWLAGGSERDVRRLAALGLNPVLPASVDLKRVH